MPSHIIIRDEAPDGSGEEIVVFHRRTFLAPGSELMDGLLQEIARKNKGKTVELFVPDPDSGIWVQTAAVAILPRKSK